MPPTAPERPPPETSRAAWAALAVAAMAMFLLPAAVTGTAIAFPDIEAEFGSSRSVLSWILSGYSIATAAFTLLGGQLSDRLGSRRVFFSGMLAFGLGGLVSAVAPSVGVLIAGRVLQGIGAAVYVPASLAMVLPQFPRTRHPSVIGIWAAAVPVGSSMAPTLSAFVLWAANWRWLFGVQAVAAGAVLAASLRNGADSNTQGHDEQPDYLGVAIGTVAVGSLALGIVQGPRWGWGSPTTIATFVVSLALLPGFLRRTRQQALPLLDLSLFSIPTFRHANIVSLAVSMVGTSVWLLWPIHLASVWEYSDLQVGLAITPTPFLAGVFSIWTGRWAERWGYRETLMIGCLLLTLANAWFWAFYGVEVNYWGRMFPGLVMYGVAMGLAFAPLNGAALIDIPDAAYGRANAAFLTGRALAGAIGIAALVAILGDANGPEALHLFDRAFVFLAIVSAMALAAVVSAWPRREPAADGLTVAQRL